MIALIVCMCLLMLCCVQWRRKKLLSQHQEAELGGTIKSIAYSDDGDEVLNLRDNRIQIKPSKHHVWYFIYVVDMNMKETHQILTENQNRNN